MWMWNGKRGQKWRLFVNIFYLFWHYYCCSIAKFYKSLSTIIKLKPSCNFFLLLFIDRITVKMKMKKRNGNFILTNPSCDFC